MVHLKKIQISNYKSIEYAEFDFLRGVWLVKATNVDAPFDSNGSGKSTLLESVHQCLYNKNPKGINIEDTYNRVTGKAYSFTLDLSIDNIDYRIINDREKDILEIEESGVSLGIKSKPKALEKIKELIGLDYSTFCAVTYVNNHTVQSMLDNLSSTNLMKAILDFESITLIEKNTKDALKESRNRVSVLINENSTNSNALDLLSEFVKTDIRPLLIRKEEKQKELMMKIQELGIENSHTELLQNREHLDSLKAELRDINYKLSNTKCKECGTVIEIDKESLEVRVDELNQEIKSTNDNIIILQAGVNTLKSMQDEINSSYQQVINNIDTQISVAEYKNKIYDEKSGELSELRKKIQENEQELKDIYFNQELYESIIKTIKEGKLHKDLLDNFTNVLNIHIKDYTMYLDTAYLTIRAKPLKNNLEFVVHDKRVSKLVPIDTLSGGELTRLRLVLLLAVLRTISDLTNSKINLLILDECLDTLDSSVSKDLSNLFQHLVNHEDKFIALVSHGEQLRDIEFTGTIRATMENRLTTVQQYEG